MVDKLTCRPIEGERIKLQPIDFGSLSGDVKNVLAWTSDEEVMESLRFFSFFQKSVTEASQCEYFARMILSSNDQLFSAMTSEGRFLGTCGLHDIDWQNGILRLGIIIFNKECRKQGYGKEMLNLLLKFAFEVLGMDKVYLTARVDNNVGIHIYKKLGFNPEGVMKKEYKVRDGQRIDLLRMSILKEDWK